MAASGSDSTAVHAIPLAGERFTGTESAEVKAPYDGAVIGRVPVCGPADVDRAVAMAKAALAAGPLPRFQRAEILDTAARLLAERRDHFAAIIAVEAAKPLKTARGEAERAVETFRFAAAEARTLAGDMVPLDATASGVGKIGFTLRVPIGVVGAISPFNFPLNLVAHKLAPAIAAGCPVVLKPASQTPFSGIALAELLIDDCGLPPEWLHVVTGGGSTVGNALVDHDDIALITFTGSPDVGWSIRGRAPRKKVGLELGNNAPVIIEPDSDWQTAATKIRVAGFSHAGQSCISTQRILVHRDIADAFTEALVKEVSSLVVGDPLDDATDVSALITEGERDRVKEWVDEAVAQGAAVAHGGELDEHGVLGADRAHRRHARHEGVLAGGVRAGRGDRHVRRPRRCAAPGERHPLRPAGGDLHQPRRRRHARLPDPRLRWRPRQRGADVAGRPAALRRRARQRQHPRRPGVLGPRDDRAADGRALALSPPPCTRTLRDMAVFTDREELVELLARYVSIPDTKDWEELPRTVFTDRVVCDFESVGGGPPREVEREVFVDGVRTFFAGWQATHHAITNHRIRIDGDVATIRAHVQAQHWLPARGRTAAPQPMVGGRVLRRRGGADPRRLAAAPRAAHGDLPGAA